MFEAASRSCAANANQKTFVCHQLEKTQTSTVEGCPVILLKYPFPKIVRLTPHTIIIDTTCIARMNTPTIPIDFQQAILPNWTFFIALFIVFCGCFAFFRGFTYFMGQEDPDAPLAGQVIITTRQEVRRYVIKPARHGPRPGHPNGSPPEDSPRTSKPAINSTNPAVQPHSVIKTENVASRSEINIV